MSQKRLHRRNDGTEASHLIAMCATAAEFVPDAITTATAREAAGDVAWRACRLRPTVVDVLDALAQRHVEGTGETLTKSETIAAALNIAMPIMVTQGFPAKGTA